VPQENSQEDEDLLQSVILPGMLELAAQYTEDLDEMRVQIDKQRARIAQLRVKKAAEPGALISPR
jgi:elongator complex protein 1